MGMVVEVVNLAFGNKKYGVFEYLVCFKINEVPALTAFKPNNLVKAVNIWPGSIALILF